MDTELLNETALKGVFRWGDVEIDLDAIPYETFVSLAKQGIIHKLGSEVAANIIKVKEKAEKDDPDLKTDEEWLENTKIELRKVMVQKILDGTVGLRISGPRGTTLENIAYELAKAQAEETLAKKGYWPKLSKEDRKNGKKIEDATVEFSGRPMTQDDLAEMVLEKYKDKLMEAAKVEHAKRLEKAKLAKANAVKSVTVVEESLDSLL